MPTSMYASDYQGDNFDPAYKTFLEGFYALSDSPDAHKEYSEQFTADAVLIMGPKRAQGRDGML
jgi:hypothetical protein